MVLSKFFRWVRERTETFLDYYPCVKNHSNSVSRLNSRQLGNKDPIVLAQA